MYPLIYTTYTVPTARVIPKAKAKIPTFMLLVKIKGDKTAPLWSATYSFALLSRTLSAISWDIKAPALSVEIRVNIKLIAIARRNIEEDNNIGFQFFFISWGKPTIRKTNIFLRLKLLVVYI